MRFACIASTGWRLRVAAALFLAVAMPSGADEIKPPPAPEGERLGLPSLGDPAPHTLADLRRFNPPSAACDACMVQSSIARSAITDYESKWEAHRDTLYRFSELRERLAKLREQKRIAQASRDEAQRAVGSNIDQARAYSPWLVKQLEDAEARLAALARAETDLYPALNQAASEAAAAAKALRVADQKVSDALADLQSCNLTRCGEPGSGATERFPESFSSQFLLGSPIDLPRYPFPQSGCTECSGSALSAQSAIQAVTKAHDTHMDTYWAHRAALDRQSDAYVAIQAAEAARATLEQIIESALNRSPQLYPRRAELDAQVAAAKQAYEAASAAATESAKTAEAAVLALQERMAAASRALSELDYCNATRCKLYFFELDSVTGVIGNNPFDASNPTGPTVTTGGQPPGGGAGTLQFNSASYAGGEGGAVLVTVVRSGGSSGLVTVRYATTPGSATQDDFTMARGTLSWDADDMTPKSFSIALANDSVVEQVESFSVSLSGPTGGATLGSPSTATVSISDASVPPPQPAGSLQFSQSSYQVMENAGRIIVTVTRSGGSAGTVTVQYFTGVGSAAVGSDYQQANGVLSWGPGDITDKTFIVPIVDDTLVEGPETFFVTLNGPTGGATLGALSTATVTIQDDDVSTPVGPCGATGNAWTPNAGAYVCSGSCSPNPSPRLSVSGDLVTATNFHGAPSNATFRGCGPTLNSNETNLTYFGQANHRASITRTGDNNFSANIVSSGGGSCAFTCTRSGP